MYPRKYNYMTVLRGWLNLPHSPTLPNRCQELPKTEWSISDQPEQRMDDYEGKDFQKMRVLRLSVISLQGFKVEEAGAGSISSELKLLGETAHCREKDLNTVEAQRATECQHIWISTLHLQSVLSHRDNTEKKGRRSKRKKKTKRRKWTTTRTLSTTTFDRSAWRGCRCHRSVTSPLCRTS